MKVTEEKALSKSLIPSVVADYFELTKPGITLLVLASMAIGFLLGTTGTFDFALLFHAVIGTVLIASGTAAHNQYIERDLDKLMLRTSKRPLPMERIPVKNALIFSTSLIFGGLFYLIATVNLVAGIVSALTAISYLLIYTPMKRVNFSNVIIGAVPGALPPVGGWAAASGSVADPGVWLLFAIVFLWQIPHVVSIAWLCNEDYTRAGFRMLPKNDENGLKSAWVSIICLLLLLPVTILLYSSGFSGIVYFIGAMLAGTFFFWYGAKFLLLRDKRNAKLLMFASIFYLPIIWIVILIDVLLT
jgi:protoheme IX farnesyltransferase